MSTSLIYHAFGIKSKYEYKRQSYEQGVINFTIMRQASECRCSSCGSKNVRSRGTKERKLRNVPIGSKPTYINVIIRRLECLDCKRILQEEIPFANGRKSYTKAFQRYVLELSKEMSIKAIAAHLKTGWDLIKQIQKEQLEKKYSKLKAKDLRFIAIDEIATHKGHKYLTVVMDLETGAIIYIAKGRKIESLDKLWRKLGRYKKNILAVAMDMWPAFIAAVTTNLPQAKIVFDHFHIAKIFNEKLSDLRRDLYRQTKDVSQKSVLKGTRWLLLKNNSNLNEEKNEKQKLEEALKLNKPLATAYYLKEELRLLWTKESLDDAKNFLGQWCRKAYAAGIRILQKMADLLLAHRTGILNYFHYKISTGPLEGTNNKIKVLKRKMYGFRDFEFFKLKVLDLHNQTFTLKGI
jgi:transposase